MVTSLLENPLMRQIGWTLLHSLWQGAVVGLVFVGLRHALRRRSARARYMAGCLCLVALVAAPLLTLALGGAGAGARASDGSDWSNRSDVSAVPMRPAGGAGEFSGGGAGWAVGGGAGFFTQLAPWLAVAWVVGVFIFSARLTRTCYSVRDLRKRGCQPVDPAWLSVLDDLRHRLGVSRPVRLLKSALVEVPTVVGWLRPVILLPVSTLSGLTPAQLETILAHELAHVRRSDYLVNAFQCAVETLMFYHPVAWWISRCIREERENCCDDMVVEICGDRVGYARALATLEGLRAELPGWAFAASGGSLLGRIRRLLGVGNERGAITIREVSGLALLAIGLIMVLFGIRMLLSTPSYHSAARIRVERDQSDIGGLGEPRGGAFYDPYFIQTEFEVIQSEIVLGKVIEQLDLNQHWGKRYANGERLKTLESMQLLRSRLDLRPVRNTSIIEIRIHDEKPEEAAKLANAVAEAYREHRLRRRMELSKGGIQALEERYSEQEAKEKEAGRQVDELRRQLGIADPMGMVEMPAESGINSPVPVMSAETLRKLESTRIEAKAEYVRQTTLLDTLKKLQMNSSIEKLAQIFTTAVPDPLLSSLLEQESQMAQKLVALQQDYGKGHSEVIKCKAMLAGLQEQITNRIDGVILGLAAKTVSLSNSLANLQAEVALATTNDVERVLKTRPYFAAIHNLEELHRFRQVLDTKISNEKLELQLPKTTMVEIVDRAVPMLRPRSPNVPQAVSLIALGLLMDLAGLLLLTGRPGAGREPRPASAPA